MSKFLQEKREKILLIYSEPFEEVSELLKKMIEAFTKNFLPEIRLFKVEESEDVNETLWKMMKFALASEEKKIVLPITADFLLAYTIYSSSLSQFYYLFMESSIFSLNGKTFLVPLHSTSISELYAFSEITGGLKLKDTLMSEILNWEYEQFKDNEVVHTFETTIPLLTHGMKNCKECGALIASEGLCKYCLRSSSHPY
ncbi:MULTISPECIES: hypothetical protein [Acidianus]|nr:MULTISPECIES: hypothetical protein [Acidianus]NON61502.1 hypothetical protein [Acidianus sp. RZ1]